MALDVGYQALLASVRPLLPVAVTLPDVSIDWRVLLGTVAFSLFATLVFGAAPALALAVRGGRRRSASGTPGTKDTGREGSGSAMPWS